jgi:hypothetical protein
MANEMNVFLDAKFPSQILQVFQVIAALDEFRRAQKNENRLRMG